VAERVLAGAVKMVLRDPTTAAKLMEQNEHERKSTLGIFLKIETLSCTVFLKYRAGIMSRNAPVTGISRHVSESVALFCHVYAKSIKLLNRQAPVIKRWRAISSERM
jgi:hypothetical protein